MRIDKTRYAPIDIVSSDGGQKFDNDGYQHWIRWQPGPDCMPGFVVQKIKRDFKYQKVGCNPMGIGCGDSKRF